MKKTLLKSLFSGVVFSLGVFAIGFIALGASKLEVIKSDPAGKKLPAENWDKLVDAVIAFDGDIAGLNGNVTTLSGGVATINSTINDLLVEIANLKNQMNDLDVPAGSVMAFDLSSCPSGWTRFSAADNRFIMGATTNSKETGGASSIYLSTDQLPSHSHYLFVPEFLRNKGRDHSSPQKTRSAIDDHDHDSGDDNYSMTIGYTNKTPSYGLSSSVGNGASIGIQNPYIKLIYCKKN